MSHGAAEPDPVAALRAGWGASGDLVRVDGGVSRLIWQVDGRYLVGWEDRHADELRREIACLEALDLGDISTPGVVRTASGDACLRTGDGWVWAVTEAVDGVAPDPGNPAHHLASATALAAFHRRLADSAPPAVRETGVLAATKRALATGAPAAAGADSAVAERARTWLARRLPLLEEAPGQLVHGDWSLPNLRLTPGAAVSVCGVLDFERVGVAPPQLDLAQAVAGALWWSSVPDPAGLAGEVVRRYEEAAGQEVDDDLLRTCLVAYWYDNWVWLDGRVRAGDRRLHAALARQPLRMASALAYADPTRR